MDQYIIVITLIGFAALGMAWLPQLVADKPFSYPIIYIGLGALLYLLPIGLPSPDPRWNEGFVVRLTELCVIVSLMGTGLKISRPLNLRHWQIPLLLVSATMVLCIVAVAFFSWWGLGFSVAAAVLLGAVVAPTDPVLASDVQVSPPASEKEQDESVKNDNVRFSLTAEAGLNDGMAFPFTWLAIAMAVAGSSHTHWFGPWLWNDLLYRIFAGVAMGWGLGKLLAYFVFTLPRKSPLPKVRDGFVALSATLLVYGLTELVHGYGFIAVFVAGLALSSDEKHSEYHREMHDFTDQIERILMAVVLMLFGGNLVLGMLAPLTWSGALLGLGFLFLIRPASAMLTLVGSELSLRERGVVSFYGIRGIGSFFYLSFALYKIEFTEEEQLWAITGFIVLVSIVLHGITASPVLKYLDKRRQQGRLTNVPPERKPDTPERTKAGNT